MRRIEKRPEPSSLERERTDGNCYGDLRKETRQAIQKQLCDEQKYLCSFCESRIEPDGKSMKIAHFVPRSVDQSLSLIWHNLYGACYGNEPAPNQAASETSGTSRDVTEDVALHCDAKQGSKCLDTRLRPDSIVAGLIQFQQDGTVYCRDLKLDKDINAKLNLNHPRLKKNRLRALKRLIADETLTGISADELVQQALADDGRLRPYLSYLLAMVS